MTLDDSIPHLSTRDVQEAVEGSYRERRRRHLFAFYGTGDDDVFQVSGVGDVRVVPVRSELELREQMPPIDDVDARIAFLVPWAHDVPLDIAGRFALDGRVRRIGTDARLRQLFGVRELDDDVTRSPLARYLLRPGAKGRYPSGEGRLTLDAMWAAWLGRDWGVPTEGGLSLGALMGWAAIDTRGAAMVEAMAQPDAVQLRDALLAQLEQRMGKAAVVVWRAWEEGRGERVLELALVLEVLAASPWAAVRVWVRDRVRRLVGAADDAALVEIARALGREAATALRHVEKQTSTKNARLIAKAADELVEDDEVRAALSESTRLPSAWSARWDALGAALFSGGASPSDPALEAAVKALRALEGHVFFKDADHEHRLRRAEMAVRLVAWLVARGDKRIEPGNTPYGEAESLARWYAEEGGYVDWARRAVRIEPEQDGFSLGALAVLRAVDDARTALDRRFARGLTAWVEAGQPATQVVPLSEVTRRVVAKFLDEREDRRLLVLLLDGMAWAQTVEILGALQAWAAPWGPIAWHGTREGRIGEGVYPAVLAQLPTVTEVSRSAFFAGKAMAPGARLDTSKDPELWAANPHVKKYESGTSVPRLLLRSEGHTQGGAASSEALSLVASAERRVVAMVLNAIDDSLKASRDVRHAWRPESITALPDLLEAARAHGRVVLLVSDHGHVPAGRFTRVRDPHPGAGASGGGARWRPWPAADAPVGENEIAVTGKQVCTPKGAHGVVLLSDDASVYASNTHAGEHGGATLAEVVAPCVIIGCEDSTGDIGRDAALAVRAPHVPRWWHFDARLAGSPVVGETAPSAPPPRPKKPKDERQLGLPVLAEPPAAPVVAAPVAAPPSAFAASEVLAARAPTASGRQDIVRAVDALLDRGGAMSAEAFAAVMGVLAFRVGGLISKLQEVLNVDGYEVVRYDPTSRQVHLDREKLAQLFEVKI